MAKIWFKEQYDFSGQSGYICGAPSGITFHYGTASCNDVDKVSWFRNKQNAFIVDDTEEDLNIFERLDSNTLKEMVL
jgi:hypothetical protein